MSLNRITVQKEPAAIAKEFPSTTQIELCCFCWKPTRYWVAPVTGQSVACCPKCAPKYHPRDLPSKAEWCRRSEEANAQTKTP